VRRLTLGALILGGGTLLSLPFRRPTLPDPSSVNEGGDANVTEFFDDESLALLVQEVTDDAQVPLAFQPQTDFSPPQPPPSQRLVPLTYEDLAVPVGRDLYYEDRFNASANVVAQNAQAANRIAELERAFAQAETAEQNRVGLPEGPVWDYGIPGPAPEPSQSTRAHLASAASSAKLTVQGEAVPKSILSQLPPPDDADASSQADRSRHWIRQPD
jgi:hypothetical protein